MLILYYFFFFLGSRFLNKTTSSTDSLYSLNSALLIHSGGGKNGNKWTCLFFFAQYEQLLPNLSLISLSQPLVNKSKHISKKPSLAAKCKLVKPLQSLTVGSAP